MQQRVFVIGTARGGQSCTQHSILSMYIYLLPVYMSSIHPVQRRDMLLCSLCSLIAILVSAPKAVKPSNVKKTPRRETM